MDSFRKQLIFRFVTLLQQAVPVLFRLVVGVLHHVLLQDVVLVGLPLQRLELLWRPVCGGSGGYDHNRVLNTNINKH